jgi:hypothetical protein
MAMAAMVVAFLGALNMWRTMEAKLQRVATHTLAAAPLVTHKLQIGRYASLQYNLFVRVHM